MSKANWKKIELIGARVGVTDPIAEPSMYRVGQGYQDPAELGYNATLREIYISDGALCMVFEVTVPKGAERNTEYFLRERLGGGELVWKVESAKKQAEPKPQSKPAPAAAALESAIAEATK